jgi:sialic acid synthase SpsE
MSISIKINNREIGPDFPPLVLAEVGINHEGDFDKAICLVDAAFNVGAEVVKFQTHITEKEMIKTDMKPGDISDESLWNIIKRCELSEEEEIKIQKYCLTKNITYLSTPFSREASDRLENMGVPAFKIGSGECNNLPLINHIAAKRRPIILSTGMNDIDSIARTVKIIEKHQCPLVILHCTSMYPTPYASVRLGAIKELKEKFVDYSIGLSDHSLGIETCLGAVALGACILEKHFTLTRDWEGPDIGISIEPDELKNLIEGSKKIWEARGGQKDILPEEKSVIDFAYASIVSVKPIKAGDVFSIDNIWVKRPGNGKLLANSYNKVIGMVSKTNINIDEQIEPEDIVGYK